MRHLHFFLEGKPFFFQKVLEFPVFFINQLIHKGSYVVLNFFKSALSLSEE